MTKDFLQRICKFYSLQPLLILTKPTHMYAFHLSPFAFLTTIEAPRVSDFWTNIVKRSLLDIIPKLLTRK